MAALNCHSEKTAMNSVLRQPGESLIIGDAIRLTVLWIKGNYVCLQVERDEFLYQMVAQHDIALTTEACA